MWLMCEPEAPLDEASRFTLEWVASSRRRSRSGRSPTDLRSVRNLPGCDKIGAARKTTS